MRTRLLLYLFFAGALSLLAQKDEELFRINGTPVMVSEFKQVYEKNIAIIEEDEARDIDAYLDLYIDYKLKIQEAYKLKLDTLKSYKRELAGYKNQLVAPYLQDEEYLNKLVKEAYERSKVDVKASHILIKLPGKGIAVDTSFVLKKINDARASILAGASFETLAKEISDDPSAKVNGGDLGYFTAFKMVYPFEAAAYNTKVNEVSKPFKTRFGYHILKVTDKRTSKGEYEVAHILVRDSQEAKTKIDSVYLKLNSGMSFDTAARTFSEDRGTAILGGKLPKFGTGAMVESFENQVRSLTKIGAYTKPFKTKFGWHIVKLLKNYPIQSFKEVEQELIKKVKKSNRAALSKKAVLDKLKKEYTVIENKAAYSIFIETADLHQLKKEKLNEVLFTIQDKKIQQKTFLEYIGHKHHQPINDLYAQFKDIQIVEYFKEDLIHREPAYKALLLEYKEGLLLFDLMQQKIWSKSSKDDKRLKEFFSKNNSNYKGKKLNEVRGLVINDYQKEIEKNWLKELRTEHKIKIKKKALKKFKKLYNQ
ncbi:MAG: peptidylprolyl isomerase [Tenacibaculum sp.]